MLIGDDEFGALAAISLINSDHPPEAVIVASRKSARSRLNHELLLIRKLGPARRCSQILLRLLMRALSLVTIRRSMGQRYSPRTRLRSTAGVKARSNTELLFLNTYKYTGRDSVDLLDRHKPDYLLVLTPYWVPRKIRLLAKSKKVIGSHPGIVPQFRGASSTFWCCYKGKIDHNGYSIFYLDDSIDCGELIKQRRVPYNRLASPEANTAILIDKIIKEYCNLVRDIALNGLPQSVKHLSQSVSACQVYKDPGLVDYFIFIFKNFGNSLRQI